MMERRSAVERQTIDAGTARAGRGGMRFVFVAGVVLAFAVAVGCNGHSPSGTPDAAKSDAKVFMDASGSGLPKCTGNAYDSCNPAASNCMTGTVCHMFNGAAFAVCAPTCTAGGSACPMQGSTAITCNMMGLCKPPMPNATCSTP